MLFTLPLSAFADNEESYTYVYDGYTIDYDIVDSWGENNQNVSVTITNAGAETIENWMLAYDLNGEATGMWNGNLATENDMIYVRNAGYNANIASNESVEFGYSLSEAEGVPSDFTMCQTRFEKYSGFDATLNVNQTWEGGFNGEIVLANTTDEPIVSWELTFDSDFTITEITNSWAASVIDNGNGNYTLKGTYTNIIYPQSSVSIGFIGVANGEPHIVNSSLTEVVC
ncbi:MAG: cellulose binding domain-containing protein [Ruminococcus sp.]|nr:cellulose binding domain-containing protein [Ruminococcus sp.]